MPRPAASCNGVDRLNGVRFQKDRLNTQPFRNLLAAHDVYTVRLALEGQAVRHDDDDGTRAHAKAATGC